LTPPTLLEMAIFHQLTPEPHFRVKMGVARSKATRRMITAKFRRSAGVAIALMLALSAVASDLQSLSDVPPAAQQHIRQLINGLLPDSNLRRDLLNGAHGDGVAKPWMIDMRQEGVKRALVWVAINFNRRGKPKRMKIYRTDYFTTYEGASKVLDTKRVTSIRTIGLEQKLTSLALENTAHGFWTDVPHRKPRPFVGGAKVEFFDDEWIPTPRVPMYCAGNSCLPEP
jgi:hypothetical protein